MYALLNKPLQLIRQWWLSLFQADRLSTDFEARKSVFAVNRLMYEGAVYFNRDNGGCLEDILRTYCGVKDTTGCRIVPHFLPAKEIVDFYVAAVLPGQWGVEIRPVELGRLGDPPTPISGPLADALTVIWRDSNLASEKSRLVRMAANLGTVGIRPWRIPGTDRVALRLDDPERIFNIEEDAAGNVTSVCLKYKLPINRGTLTDPKFEDVDVVETITKDEFSLTYNGQQQVPEGERKNPYGFCPYVILRHRDSGNVFGDHAYKGSEFAFHDINWRITRQGLSIDRTQFAEWFIASGGPPPTSIPMGGGQNAHYAQLSKDTPPTTVQAIVPEIDQEHTLKYTLALMAMMRDRQPELVFGDVELMSGLSGETIAHVLKPAESRVRDIRPNYDHALVRALQMAVSIRIDSGLERGLGGSGDDAYKSGKLAFQFADRPALPPTTYQQESQARAEQAPKMAKLSTAAAEKALGVDKLTYLQTAGYTEEEAKAMLGRAAEDDVIEDNDL